MTWPTVTLGDVARIDRDSVAPTDIEAGSRYVGLEHIESGGGYLSFGKVSNGELASNKFRFGPHHILFGKLRPYLAKIVCPDFHGVCSTDILPIAPSERVDRRYLLHFLRHPKTVGWASNRATGVNLPRLSPNQLASLELPLPPAGEQRRLSSILDEADGVRRKLKRALELLNVLNQSIFGELFVAGHSSTWPERTIGELSEDMRTGPFGSQLLHSEFVGDGIAVLGIDNAVGNEFAWDERRYITKQKYESLKRYTVKPGDVLITIMGTCGRCAVVPDDIPLAINTKHLCCITLKSDHCLPAFLHAAFLQHPAVLQQLGVQAKGAVMPGLNMGIIKSIALPLPPFDLQQTFAKRASKLKDQIRLVRRMQEASDSLFASLQHRAFAGQL